MAKHVKSHSFPKRPFFMEGWYDAFAYVLPLARRSGPPSRAGHVDAVGIIKQHDASLGDLLSDPNKLLLPESERPAKPPKPYEKLGPDYDQFMVGGAYGL